MRVALVHYWLLGMRGGEKVLEALCRTFPEADIFTLFYEPGAVSPLIRSRNVKASFLNPLRRAHRSLLPLMPMALEDFDLRPYDLIISSESGPAKGVLTSATSRHFCYCHTPMRYLWELYPAHRHEYGENWVRRTALAPIANYMRLWDYATAARVDGFIANSVNVKRRIWRTYRRRSSVVHPPVAVDTFRYQPPEDYFLMVAEMVPYKKLDYAIRYFAQSGRRLKVVGAGPEYKSLKKLVGPSVEFCGRVTETGLRDLYSRCRALIVPGEEDFGITMVEALASGKPVLAVARGGAVEIVGNGQGILYPESDEASLAEALRSFDRIEPHMDPQALIDYAAGFSEQVFQKRFLDAIGEMWSPKTRSVARSGGPVLVLPRHAASGE
ncbi:MAG TPA: glycosyltransferase [Bryobacteraceae bacterium]|nr:glycosyltransferase [Bryobacteraceae bacterium]